MTTAMPGIASFSMTDGLAGLVVSTTITSPCGLEPTTEPVAVVEPTSSDIAVHGGRLPGIRRPVRISCRRIGRIVVDHAGDGRIRRIVDVDDDAFTELGEDLVV